MLWLATGAWLGRVVVALLALAAASPVGAEAAVRDAAIDDPRDQATNPAGGQSRPDIAQVRFSYDDYGSLSITGRFHEPLPQSDLQGFALAVDLFGTDQTGVCGLNSTRVLSGYVRLPEGSSGFIPNYAVNWRPGGAIVNPSSRTVSADGLEISATFADVGLSGVDVRCADAKLLAYSQGGGEPTVTDSTPRFYVSGFEPKPMPAPLPAVVPRAPALFVPKSRISSTLRRGVARFIAGCDVAPCDIYTSGTVRIGAASYHFGPARRSLARLTTYEITVRVPSRAIRAARRAITRKRRVTLSLNVYARDPQTATRSTPTTRRSTYIRRVR